MSDRSKQGRKISGISASSEELMTFFNAREADKRSEGKFLSTDKGDAIHEALDLYEEARRVIAAQPRQELSKRSDKMGNMHKMDNR